LALSLNQQKGSTAYIIHSKYFFFLTIPFSGITPHQDRKNATFYDILFNEEELTQSRKMS